MKNELNLNPKVMALYELYFNTFSPENQRVAKKENEYFLNNLTDLHSHLQEGFKSKENQLTFHNSVYKISLIKVSTVQDIVLNISLEKNNFFIRKYPIRVEIRVIDEKKMRVLLTPSKEQFYYDYIFRHLFRNKLMEKFNNCPFTATSGIGTFDEFKNIVNSYINETEKIY